VSHSISADIHSGSRPSLILSASSFEKRHADLSASATLSALRDCFVAGLLADSARTESISSDCPGVMQTCLYSCMFISCLCVGCARPLTAVARGCVVKIRQQGVC